MRASKFANMPFERLKVELEKKRFPLKEKTVSEDKSDEELFREAMSDVRELPEFRRLVPQRTSKVPSFPLRHDDALDILSRIVKGKEEIRLTDTGEYIAWAGPRVRKDILDRLHGGSYAVQDSIDLHGMTLDEAETALSDFFSSSLKKGYSCVKVIHGRGLRSPRGPVLKKALERFLHRSFRKWVLAYVTARRRDGGLGATYVVLKST